jgi:hypothetical protein
MKMSAEIVRSVLNINGRTMQELAESRYASVAVIAACFAIG